MLSLPMNPVSATRSSSAMGFLAVAFGAVAPVGGACFLIGWACVTF